ncbi:FtsX-like permease family protein [Solibacillus sp. FSL H8-0523]|uniref:FtsX-like permease family protein n=1 Tax=Solibacillus sp. FSL H8-0523 TaxID=2954511 RepID=UPI0031015D99
MKLSQLVFKSMLKNIRHYYLYFFALIFSVTLYFSFETLQYNPSVIEATTRSGSASAGFGAATYMLYAIVLVFVLYANHLFIRRRSKEIGLYQLIGMTKGLVIRLIVLENIVIFAGSVVIGMGIGLLSSRLFAMILLKVLNFEAVVKMTFRSEAVVSTALMFGLLLVIILIQMAWMVHRTTLLALFNQSKQTDEKVKRFSLLNMVMGVIGLALIAYGYYKSTILFSAESGGDLFTNMLLILATTIGGTFLVFRFSVAFVLNIFRSRKQGHLSLGDVLALTPIMHRMKSNSKSLTLITVMTAFSLAITTLSYISYYSSQATAEQEVPGDYIAVNGNETAFLGALDEQGISYQTEAIHLEQIEIDNADFLPDYLVETMNGQTISTSYVVSLADYTRFYPELVLKNDEIVVTSYNGFSAKFAAIDPGKQMKVFIAGEQSQKVIKAVHEDAILSWRLTSSSPVFVVNDAVFEQIKVANTAANVRVPYIVQTAIQIDETQMNAHQQQIENLYKTTNANLLKEGSKLSSQEAVKQDNLNLFGTTIFVTAFLGLAFLLATGSILYFKQMSEADEEAASYTILRKIGFTEQEVLRGIMLKQLFNFGVPLLIGLLHSYFAVKSGWFMFGTELVTPLVITMSLYIAMYVVFAILTINYYKKIIKQAL